MGHATSRPAGAATGERTPGIDPGHLSAVLRHCDARLLRGQVEALRGERPIGADGKKPSAETRSVKINYPRAFFFCFAVSSSERCETAFPLQPRRLSVSDAKIEILPASRQASPRFSRRTAPPVQTALGHNERCLGKFPKISLCVGLRSFTLERIIKTRAQVPV